MPSCTCKKRKKTGQGYLRAADLPDRFIIESPSDVYGTDGSITRTYSTDYSRWARITPRGAEPDQFREIEGHTTYTIEFVYDSAFASGLKDTHRLTHSDGRIFDILRIENHAPTKLICICNDYAAVISQDGLTHDGNSYDAILRNEKRTQEYTDAGLEKTLRTIALARVSEFSPAFSALNEDVNVRGAVLRVIEVEKAQRSDWLKLTLKQEFD